MMNTAIIFLRILNGLNLLVIFFFVSYGLDQRTIDKLRIRLQQVVSWRLYAPIALAATD